MHDIDKIQCRAMALDFAIRTLGPSDKDRVLEAAKEYEAFMQGSVVEGAKA